MYITEKKWNQKSQRCSVAYLYLDTEYAMGTVPIAYSVSKYKSILLG